MIFKTAEKIQSIARRLGIPFIFKSSYKKANRSSGKSFSSIGVESALKILGDVKREFGIPILTDVHSEKEVQMGAEVADVLQIPAFLCRQTELLEAAGKSGKAVNIKKGQFVAPEDMALAAEKVASTGNKRILLTERGSTFGYHNLVVDMRSLPIMRRTGYPVVLDATHSVQLPGGERDKSGGQPEFIFPIARAGVAAGCDAVFIETHPNPAKAKSDAASQLKLDLLEDLLQQLVALDGTMKRFRSN
jgi:2-dehydro-3-deoxyphosphooctonate aldolase (KDO 8-P synthase)